MNLILNHFVLDLIFLSIVIFAMALQQINHKLSHYSLLLTCFALYYLFKKMQTTILHYIHDIKSPIEVLRNTTNNCESLRQIELISKSLTKKDILVKLNPLFVIQELISMKKEEYPHVNIQIIESQFSTIQASHISLKRTLSNLINNSVQANANTITLSLKIIQLLLIIEIIDNGTGIKVKHLKKGGGLKSAYKFAKKTDGSFSIQAISNGSKAIFKIPIIKNINHAIYIDDDKLSRWLWKKRAHDNSIQLDCFATPTEIDFNQYDYQTPIYIDSILSNNVIGERVAFRLYTKGFQNLILTTGKDNPRHYPWINKTMGKAPPWGAKFQDA